MVNEVELRGGDDASLRRRDSRWLDAGAGMDGGDLVVEGGLTFTTSPVPNAYPKAAFALEEGQLVLPRLELMGNCDRLQTL